MKKHLLMLTCAFAYITEAQSLDDSSTTITTADQPYSVVDGSSSEEVVKNVKLSNLRLGFVNFRRIMGTIPQLTAVRQTLDEEFKVQQKSLQEAQDELNALEKQALQKASDSDYDSFTQQLIAKRRDVARQDAAFRDNYSVRRNEELAKLQNLVLDEIVGLAKEQGFDVILNDTGVIYVSEKADLTNLVIERLNKLSKQQTTSPTDAVTPPQKDMQK